MRAEHHVSEVPEDEGEGDGEPEGEEGGRGVGEEFCHDVGI